MVESRWGREDRGGHSASTVGFRRIGECEGLGGFGRGWFTEHHAQTANGYAFFILAIQVGLYTFRRGEYLKVQERHKFP